MCDLLILAHMWFTPGFAFKTGCDKVASEPWLTVERSPRIEMVVTLDSFLYRMLVPCFLLFSAQDDLLCSSKSSLDGPNQANSEEEGRWRNSAASRNN